MRSASPSPERIRLSTTAGRSWMETLSNMDVFRPSATEQTIAAPVLLARQQAMQGSVERPTAPINIAVDGFVTDAIAARFLGHAPGNLLRRPALGEALQN